MTEAKSSREIAEQWEILARGYEAQIKALCDSDDPVSLLADWCAHAGLPEPKALSYAAERERLLELQTEALNQISAMRSECVYATSHKMRDIADAARPSSRPATEGKGDD